MFSKKLFLCQTNVHPILDFLTRRGKFILSFLDFYLFFYELFSAERIKKKQRRADWAERSRARLPARPASSSSRTSAAAARSLWRAQTPPPPSPPPAGVDSDDDVELPFDLGPLSPKRKRKVVEEEEVDDE